MQKYSVSSAQFSDPPLVPESPADSAEADRSHEANDEALERRDPPAGLGRTVEPCE